MKYSKPSKKTIISIIVFALIAFLFFAFRFINIEKRIIFDWDQEQFSNQIKDILVHGKFTLLGPRVTNVEGFFLAPYLTYILLPFYIFSNLHPSGLIPFLITVNILFMFASIFVISRYFAVHHALGFFLLWATNPLLIQYDTLPWWPILIPLGVIITWLLLFQIYNDESKKSNWIMLGIVLGFFCNMHVQFIFINLFTVVFLVISLRTRIKSNIRNILFLFLSFCFMFAPLVIFDLRHDFLNLQLIASYFSKSIGESSRDIYAWHPVFNNFIRPVLPTNNINFSTLFFYLLPLFSLFVALKNEGMKRAFYLSTSIVLILTILGFSFYGKRPSEYYYVFLYPFIYMIILDFITKKRIWLIFTFAFVLFFINFQTLQATLKDNNFGLYYKDLAVKELIPYTKGKKFNITFDVPLGAHTGYDYLIDHNGIEQSGDFTDPLVQIHIPPHKNDYIVHLIGFSIPKEFSEVSSEKN